MKTDKPTAIFLMLALLSFSFAVAMLLILLASIINDGFSRLTWQFLTQFPSRNPEMAGILSSWVGSFYLMILY